MSFVAFHSLKQEKLFNYNNKQYFCLFLCRSTSYKANEHNQIIPLIAVLIYTQVLERKYQRDLQKFIYFSLLPHTIIMNVFIKAKSVKMCLPPQGKTKTTRNYIFSTLTYLISVRLQEKHLHKPPFPRHLRFCIVLRHSTGVQTYKT